MADGDDLANRIRELTADEPDVIEQRMSGGLAFLAAGNMAVAASGQGALMVRIDPEETNALLAEPHAQGDRDARPRQSCGRRRRRAIPTDGGCHSPNSRARSAAMRIS